MNSRVELKHEFPVDAAKDLVYCKLRFVFFWWRITHLDTTVKSWKGINKKESRILTTSKLITCWETLKLADSKFFVEDMFVSSSHSPVAVGHSWSITQRAVATTQWWGRMEAARYSGTQFFSVPTVPAQNSFFLYPCMSYPFKYLQKMYTEEATKTTFKTSASIMLRSQHLWLARCFFLGVFTCCLGSQAGRRLPHVSRGEPARKKEIGISWKLTEDGQFSNSFTILKRFFLLVVS